MAEEREIMNALVGHRVGLERYSKRVIRDVIALLEAADADIAAQITAHHQLGGTSPKRLEELKKRLREVNAEAHAAFRGELVDQLVDVAKYEAEWSALLYSGLQLDLDFITPNAQTLRSLVTSRPFQGAVLRDWAKGVENDTLRKVMQQVRIGVLEGEPTSAVVARSMAVLPQKRRHATSMVRTAINHVTNAAHDQFAKDNPRAFRFIRWVSVLDGRTSPICRARAGKVYAIDSGPRPPAHWQCRSTIINLPVGTEFSSEPQYDEWLGEQDSETVDDILGPTRGKLFREGSLSTAKMVDRFGGELTLGELRKRDARAFKRAGIDGLRA